MIVADVMTKTSVCVTSQETVLAASDAIRRHHLPGLPVVDGGRVVGVVTPIQLLHQPSYRAVLEVMSTEITPVAADLPLLQAYTLLTRQRVDVLPVVQEGRLVGQISLTAILQAKGWQTDPLTGLPWAVALRIWAGAALGRGSEVAILFIDLDSFGVVNKALGHNLGDDILRAITYLLESFVNASTDLLCRYGGDEFAIATIRPADEARALVQRIQETVSLPVKIGGARQQLTVSVGFAGGRRRAGRVPSHVAAAVDDLLTLARRASAQAKETVKRRHRRRAHEEGGVEGPHADQPLGEARLRLDEVVVHAEPDGCTALVKLSFGTREETGTVSGHVRGRGVSFLIAQATLEAVSQILGDGHAYHLEDLVEIPFEGDRLVVAVLSDSTGTSRRLAGTALANDLAYAVSRAILAALNRSLAGTLTGLLRSTTP